MIFSKKQFLGSVETVSEILNFVREGTTGARRLVGARPVEQTRAQEVQLKKIYSAGGQGDFVPLGLPPPQGKSGAPSQTLFGEGEMISTEPIS